MQHRFKAFPLAILAVSLCAGGALAQDTGSAPDRAAQYAALAKLPAFEGVWQADWSTITKLRGAENSAPLTPEARAIVDAFNSAKEEGKNLQTEGANCMPVGLPGAMRYPYPVEIIFSPGKVNIVIETHSQVRSIYTDGRALPEDPDPFYNGSSVGHWEGDTLVVDTIGLSPQTSILAGLHPTEATRIRERFHLEAPDRLILETTITDPALFSAPFVTSVAYKLEPDWTIREYVCAENNRDAADAEGRPSMDLGLDQTD